MAEVAGEAVAVTCTTCPGPGKAACCDDNFFGPDRFFSGVNYKRTCLFGYLAYALVIEKINTEFFGVVYERISYVTGTVGGWKNTTVLLGPGFESKRNKEFQHVLW
jgi:hypothetical protein